VPGYVSGPLGCIQLTAFLAVSLLRILFFLAQFANREERILMVLKPQDILILVKLVALEEAEWSYSSLGMELSMSPSRNLYRKPQPRTISSIDRSSFVASGSIGQPPIEKSLPSGIEKAKKTIPLQRQAVLLDRFPQIPPSLVGFLPSIDELPIARRIELIQCGKPSGMRSVNRILGLTRIGHQT
jgi:hypothetical protein